MIHDTVYPDDLFHLDFTQYVVKRFNLLLWFNLRPFVQKCSKIEPTFGFKPY